MEYNPWIPLIHNILVMTFSFLTMISSTNLLFYKFLYKRNIKLIPILQVYFCYQFIWSSTSLINTVYLILFWRQNESLYNERLIYLFGVLPDTLLFLNSVMGILLCTDRCLTIIFPFKYDKNCEKIFGIFTAASLVIIYGLAIWVNKPFEIIPPNRPSNCYYRGCIVGSSTAPNFTQQKIAISIVDIFAGIFLFILIRCNFHFQNSSNFKRLNAKALFIVFSSTMFDFCPSLIFRFISLNLERPLSWYIGPYLITLGSFGVTICSRSYANAFKSTSNTSVQHLS